MPQIITVRLIPGSAWAAARPRERPGVHSASAAEESICGILCISDCSREEWFWVWKVCDFQYCVSGEHILRRIFFVRFIHIILREIGAYFAMLSALLTNRISLNCSFDRPKFAQGCRRAVECQVMFAYLLMPSLQRIDQSGCLCNRVSKKSIAQVGEWLKQSGLADYVKAFEAFQVLNIDG